MRSPTSRVTTIINTHTHWDHTGANTEFPDTVDDIVGSYSVPSQYSDFSAPENSLRSTVQYVFDGQ